jgi:Ca2+-binding EF-hand superfamily protein
VPDESNMLGAHRSFEKTNKNIFPSTQTLENGGVKSLSICKVVRNKIFSAFNKLKEAFKTFDLNNDGYISKEEFLLGITALVGDAIVLTDKDVLELFQAFSDNGNNAANKIRYYQFCKVLQRLNDNNNNNNSLEPPQRLLTPVYTPIKYHSNNTSPYLVYNDTMPIELKSFPSTVNNSLSDSFDSTSTIDVYDNHSYNFGNSSYFDNDDIYNIQNSSNTVNNNTQKFNNNVNASANQGIVDDYEIYFSESLPYVDTPISEIMVKLANFVFGTSKKLKEIFRAFDLNNDGYISKHELIDGLAAIGITVTLHQVEDLISEYSSSRANSVYKLIEDGEKLEYYQFCNLLSDSKNVLSQTI